MSPGTHGKSALRSFTLSAGGKAETWCKAAKMTQHSSDIHDNSSEDFSTAAAAAAAPARLLETRTPTHTPPARRWQRSVIDSSQSERISSIFLPLRKSDTPEIDRRDSALLSILMTFHSQLCPSLSLNAHPHTHTHTDTLSHHRCHRGDGGHLIVFCPGLQVLQGVERGVGQAQRVGLQRLAQRLLERFLLKLQHQPVGLLPLGLPLLCGLSPGWMEATKQKRRGRCTVRPLAVWGLCNQRKI